MADLGAVILRAVRALNGRGLPKLVLPKLKSQVTSTGVFLSSSCANNFAVQILPPAVPNAWQTILDLTGAGLLRGIVLNHQNVGGTAQTMKVRITLDGSEHEETFSITANSGLIVAIGCHYDSYNNGSTTELKYVPNGLFPFRKSLKIETHRTNAAAGLAAHADYFIEG